MLFFIQQTSIFVIASVIMMLANVVYGLMAPLMLYHVAALFFISISLAP